MLFQLKELQLKAFLWQAFTAVLSTPTQQLAACDGIRALQEELLSDIFLQIKFDPPKGLLKNLNPKHAEV